MGTRDRFFSVVLAVLVTAGLAGSGGYLLGLRHAADAAAPAARDAVPQPAATDPVPAPADDFENLLASAAWFQLEAWLSANRATVTPAHGRSLVATLRSSVNKYDALVMRQVLASYLEAQPNDHEALFLLADLQQVSGLSELALETLFDLMQLPLDAGTQTQAQIEADRIVQAIDAQLRNRGAAVEREAFRREMSQRMPLSDRYRYEWAVALADVQRIDEASRVLAETGTADIAQATLDELAERLELVEQGVTFIRDGDRLLSQVSAPSGLTFMLLVDTGANITSFTRDALRTLGAERLGEDARVRTASGIVTTGVYRVSELNVQGQYFSDVRVLELPAKLPGLDGLLGTDIIQQLSADPLNLQR